MSRKQFTFYRSFWVALESLPKGCRLDFVEAVCAYALEGEKRPLAGSAASAFALVVPVLDTARRRAASGKTGGERTPSSPKQTASKTEANGKQTVSKTQAKRKQNASEGEKERETEKEIETEVETEKEKEIETETENDCYTPSSDDDDPPTPQRGDRVGVGVAVVRVVGELRPKARKELAAFLRGMGEDCVLRALDVAQDAGKPNWAYVRGVLRRKQEQGVHSLQDWDALEQRWARDKQPTIAGTPRDVQPDPDRIQRSSEWLESFLAEQERAAQSPASSAGRCSL